MKIHEYQAKAILNRYGVPVPRGEVAFTPDEAGDIARRLGGEVVVVKAQIHAGGRGKGGGVKLARGADEAIRIARDMIGMRLVTHQTGPEGRIVSRVLVEEGLKIDRELYVSLLLDRAAGQPIIMASAAGGMDIEEVAAATPERIVREHVHPGVGLLGVSDAEDRLRARARRPAAREDGEGAERPLRRVPGHRRIDARDQPAHRHGRRATCWRSTRR